MTRLQWIVLQIVAVVMLALAFFAWIVSAWGIPAAMAAAGTCFLLFPYVAKREGSYHLTAAQELMTVSGSLLMISVLVAPAVYTNTLFISGVLLVSASRFVRNRI
jgi:hypothetical protein